MERKSVAIWMDYPETVCFPIANHANSIWYNERVYNQYLFTYIHFFRACRLHALKIIDTDVGWNLCITYLRNARVKFQYKTYYFESCFSILKYYNRISVPIHISQSNAFAWDRPPRRHIIQIQRKSFRITPGSRDSTSLGLSEHSDTSLRLSYTI